jgi:DNA-directed RNA polymerase specialized sigma24 family protein
MNSPISLTLEQFNQQVLACQDDAFTLAIALVGEEELACQIVQEVIRKVYISGRSESQSIDLQVLRGVVFSCRRATHSPFRESITMPGWKQLKRHQKELLLLVDVLGKTYDETALILNISWQETIQNLARGRHMLTISMHAEIVPCVKEILSK